MVDGCFYGLWSESGYYVRDCPDSSLNEAAQFKELSTATEPVFRFNRSSIAINDLADGSVLTAIIADAPADIPISLAKDSRTIHVSAVENG